MDRNSSLPSANPISTRPLPPLPDQAKGASGQAPVKESASRVSPAILARQAALMSKAPNAYLLLLLKLLLYRQVRLLSPLGHP